MGYVYGYVLEVSGKEIINTLIKGLFFTLINKNDKIQLNIVINTLLE